MIFAFGNSVIAFFQSPAFDLRLAQVVIIILTIIAFEALSYHLYLKRSGKLKEDKKEKTIDVYSQNNLDTCPIS